MTLKLSRLFKISAGWLSQLLPMSFNMSVPLVLGMFKSADLDVGMGKKSNYYEDEDADEDKDDPVLAGLNRS